MAERILIASPTQGVYGGIESFVFTVAGHLEAETGFKVRVCLKLVEGHDCNPTLSDHIRRLPYPVVLTTRGGRELFREIRRADLVHGQNASPDIVLGARLFGKPLVLTIHNWLRRGGLRNRVWHLASRFAARRWYNSEFVLGTWERTGADTRSRCVPTVSQLPTERVPPEQRRGFVFLARWIANKGLEELIPAYAAADIDRDAWPLTLLGTGPLRPEIEAAIERHGLTTVRDLGFVDAATKYREIASAKWLLAPANTREDMGLTPIEARNVGVPSIVTRDGGLPEAGGPAALIAEPGDTDSLRRCLEQAAALPEADYLARSATAFDSLAGYLEPLSFYPRQYRELLG